MPAPVWLWPLLALLVVYAFIHARDAAPEAEVLIPPHDSAVALIPPLKDMGLAQRVYRPAPQTSAPQRLTYAEPRLIVRVSPVANAAMASPPVPSIRPAPKTIVGVASTYDPRLTRTAHAVKKLTASGEPYDATAWTAAIRIDLRARFGGVHFGAHYRPAYALVEAGDKRAVVRINDVGPLKPGRVIDLNHRTMRYFDPSLERGLIRDFRVIPLPGTHWKTGPLGKDAQIAGTDEQS